MLSLKNTADLSFDSYLLNYVDIGIRANYALDCTYHLHSSIKWSPFRVDSRNPPSRTDTVANSHRIAGDAPPPDSPTCCMQLRVEDRSRAHTACAQFLASLTANLLHNPDVQTALTERPILQRRGSWDLVM
ncbi:uncharacterized protein RAG0_03965 [Rhynchosporium agropyri]|uniref:Uncharacterized protein n=1 Tax=Rhynchosporium agropyri TaxID=914238 RepID=A0A1E1K7F1_9HELO|nr:uncharacterized protein RAG0_03965 [Rhynchosporium agropyri]